MPSEERVMNKRVALFEVKELKDSDDANGSFEAILSVPVIDRDGEVVAPGAFEPLPAEIPIHKFHDFSSPVATAVPFYDGDVLKARGVFDPDPDSQAIRSKIGRSIRYMSVGFMAAKYSDAENPPTIVKAELLEASFVSVPANREAAILAVKDASAVGFATRAESVLADLRSVVDRLNENMKQIEDGRVENRAADPENAAAPAAASPADATVKHLHLWAEADLVLLGCDTNHSTEGAT
jgi:HK97 family phage prohead protease